MNDLAYHLKNISHYYGSTKVLDIEELKIPKGSITGLIGPNGSGKSTLLKLLAFAQKPTKGAIYYNGKLEYCFSPSIRSRVTLLTQTPYLLKRTVFENIAYGLKIRKVKKDIKARVEKALFDVGLDYEDFAQRKWHQLSGGEAQRVAMAARMILKPEVLLLDEPVASVDTKSARMIRNASLKAQEKWGATLVVASHDLQWLYSVSDTHLSIFNGNIFTSGLENVIQGPFEKTDKQNMIKNTGDGQRIILQGPLNKSGKEPGSFEEPATAVIKKKHIFLENQSQKAVETPLNADNQLSGHIVSMLLQKKSNNIMANILVGDLSFVLELMPEKVSALDLYPGKVVTLEFSSHDIEWI